jgi:hypothetical protein
VDAQAETTGHPVGIATDVPILRIDHASIKGKLHGVWQALYGGGVLDFKEMNRRFCLSLPELLAKDIIMKNIKFIVKVNRGGTRAPAYVQRVDASPIHMTTNRKLALLMGKFTAEDAAKSLQTSQCVPELVSVLVTA